MDKNFENRILSYIAASFDDSGVATGHGQSATGGEVWEEDPSFAAFVEEFSNLRSIVLDDGKTYNFTVDEWNDIYQRALGIFKVWLKEKKDEMSFAEYNNLLFKFGLRD